MIRIISKRDGFRRAGIRHATTPVEYPDDAFTKAQLESLMAEPMLDVQLIEDKPKGKSAKTEDAK